MGLRDDILSDIKAAMKAKDVETRDTLRLLSAAIKQADVDGGQPLDNEAVQSIVMKQAKQRRESIVEYEKAGRDDLVEPEKKELAVIEKYLPKMMDADEIRVLAAAAIAETGATSPKQMGAIMGKLMPQVKGKADGKLVNQVVRELLNG
ncbi:MAG: GatB/YqeY domain-containing protein [Chloroflexota bacterium]